jgi:2-polyprenyl-6-methoxyphenol hydroxylase-like FAD-dependent oxidoreductase
MSITKILISGAGIAGLALAASLESNDEIEVHVVEKSSNIRPLGAAICLPANATACLSKLGILDELLSQAFQVEFWEIFTAKGEPLHRTFSKDFCQDTPFIAVERAQLHDLLIRECQKTNFMFNAEIKEIKENKEGVEVSINNKQERYDLVIGADGIYSKVRSLVAPQIHVKDLGAVCWRAMIKRPDFLDQPHFYLGDQEFLLLHPIDSDRAYCGAIARNSPRFTSSALEIFRETYLDFPREMTNAIFSEIVSDEKLLERKIETLSQIEWGSERVILIGDASHACAPAMQQGGSQGLEDALMLAEFINNNERLSSIARSFKSSRNERVQFVSDHSNKATVQFVSLSSSDVENRNKAVKSGGLQGFKLWHDLFRSNLGGGQI